MVDLPGNTFFEGPAGLIEGILKEPEGPVARAAVVCHPHPLFGGTMHNKVVYRIAKAFQDEGFAALRFNFRGTGKSEGEHDHGRGEQDDLRAAMGYLGRKYPDAELWAGGFSFGSAVTLRAACADPRVRALVAVGLPVSKYGFDETVNCSKPTLLIQGSEDEFGRPSDLEKFYASMSGPKRLRVIDGTGHFFDGQLDELAMEVKRFVESVVAAGNPA